jgi:hypothetical protein
MQPTIKLIAAIIAFMCFSTNLIARGKVEHEFQVGYGYWSFYHIGYETLSGLTTAFSFGTVQQSKIISSVNNTIPKKHSFRNQPINYIS